MGESFWAVVACAKLFRPSRVYHQRAGVVATAINSAVPTVAFAVTTSGGNNFGTTNNTITLTGTAPLAVKTIEVNGVNYPITWTSTTAWSVQLPLLNGPNFLTVQGLNNGGVRLSNSVDTITVTNSGAGTLLPVLINEWMADNAGPGGLADPVDGLFQDWFELFNPNTNSVNLAGFYLTDNLNQPAKWQIPLGTIIAPQGFLLVWADNEPAQNSNYGLNGQLHAGFQLDADGESLGLFSPGLVAQHAVVFGRQNENVSQGLVPDGVTNTVYSMTNWTPQASNTLADPPRARIVSFSGGIVTLSLDTIAGRTYRLEFKDTLNDPNWQLLGSPFPALTAVTTATDNVLGKAQRFYRLKRLD
jgi:hypothetical protein